MTIQNLFTKINNAGYMGKIAVPSKYRDAELSKGESLYYGINPDTGEPLYYNRAESSNPGGFIIGYYGSGKSTIVLTETATALLCKDNIQVIIIDTHGEYRKLCKAFDGSLIEFIADEKIRNIKSFSDLSKENCDILDACEKEYFKPYLEGIAQDARCVVYDLSKYQNVYRKTGQYICLRNIQQRIIENAEKGIKTWVFSDEIDELLIEQPPAQLIKNIYSNAKHCVFTGIIHSPDIICDSNIPEVSDMSGKPGFLRILNMPLMDLEILKKKIPLEDSQIEYISYMNPGHGLINDGTNITKFTLIP